VMAHAVATADPIVAPMGRGAIIRVVRQVSAMSLDVPKAAVAPRVVVVPSGRAMSHAASLPRRVARSRVTRNPRSEPSPPSSPRGKRVRRARRAWTGPAAADHDVAAGGGAVADRAAAIESRCRVRTAPRPAPRAALTTMARLPPASVGAPRRAPHRRRTAAQRTASRAVDHMAMHHPRQRQAPRASLRASLWNAALRHRLRPRASTGRASSGPRHRLRSLIRAARTTTSRPLSAGFPAAPPRPTNPRPC
jgi:hypothetical protein